MRDWLISARWFLWGVVKRGWALLAGIALGVVDAVQFHAGKAVDVPNWLVWTVLILGLVVAAIGTFDEVRPREPRVEADFTWT